MSVKGWLDGFYDSRAFHGGVGIEIIEQVETGDFSALYSRDMAALRKLGM